MNRLILLTSALLFSACAPLIANAETARAEAIPQVVTKELAVTIYDTPQPTPDYQATAQAAQREAVAAIDARLAAEREQLEAEQTAEAVKVEALRITATMGAETGSRQMTQQAVAATAEAYRIDATATLARVEVERSEANAKLLLNQSINTRANTEAKTAIGTIIIGVIAAMCLLLFLLVVVRGVWNYGKPAEPKYDINEAMEPQQINASPREAYRHEVNITWTEKTKLIEAAKEWGGQFSRRKLTPKYFTELDWERIEAELLRVGPSGVSLAIKPQHYTVSTLTREGWSYLGLVPLSPTETKFVPCAADSADETHSTPPQDGGGVVIPYQWSTARPGKK